MLVGNTNNKYNEKENRKKCLKQALSHSPEAISKEKFIKFCESRGLKPSMKLISKYISDSPS